MAAKRLWGLIGVCVLAALATLSLARAQDESTQGPDFLVLAIKPEGDLKDFRMVPIGEAAIDPVQYRDVVKSLPRSLFGGVIVRPHDERAELGQCRTACAANAKCGNFTYVRPGKDRPVGVCHLRRAIEQPQPNTVAMTPVVENAAPPPELVVVSPVVAPVVSNERKLIVVDSVRNGRALYTSEQVPVAPVTFRFKAPVASAKADVRAAGRERVWANVEALDTHGRVFKRSGSWIAADGSAHQVLVRTENNRIGALRISTRNPGALTVDGVDFIRATPTLADATLDDDVDAVDEADAETPPPPVPQVVAENFPMPPRAVANEPPVATEQPAAIVELPAIQTPPEVTVTELAADGSHEATITIPIAPATTAATADGPVSAPITVESSEPILPRDLPVLEAFGAVAFLLGGAGLYRQSYRRRTLARLTTNIITDGRARPTVSLTTDEPDMSLRFAVRAYASAGARQTTITITPDGAAA